MANKNWQLASIEKDDLVTDNPAIEAILSKLLKNRGIHKKTDIDFFLSATYDKDSFDPFLFVDMQKSIELLISHIKKRSKICVYGDYDADGVSSTALIVAAFNLLKLDVEYYIPHRSSEGYGLNIKAIDKIAKTGAKLIITVDTGIRNKKEVDYIKSLGIDCIITDHHQGPIDISEYPECPIVNPALSRESKVDKKLAGVGVALKFVEALVDSSKLATDSKSKLKESLFDMACLGTVADCVSLHGENRLIVKKGLEIISKKPRLGLRELIAIAGIKNTDDIDSWNIGFQIAPRVNAAGRMKHANTALMLMLSQDKKEANKYAKELNYNNQMRQESTLEIFENVLKQTDKQKDDLLIAAIYKDEELGDKPWNEGIIGLVSGRITEKYHKPSLVITETEGFYKGSGRSIEGFDIVKAMESSSEHLEKYGGHPMACGFSLKKENLDKFVSSMKKIARSKLDSTKLEAKINIDCQLDFSKINPDFIKLINQLKPFGQDNPQPVFLSKKLKIVDRIEMGMKGQHLKLRLKNGDSSVISAIGFNQAKKWSELNIGDYIDIVYNLDINHFNGRLEAQLKIIDIKNHA